MLLKAEDKKKALELFKSGKHWSDCVSEVPGLTAKQLEGIYRRFNDTKKKTVLPTLEVSQIPEAESKEVPDLKPWNNEKPTHLSIKDKKKVRIDVSDLDSLEDVGNVDGLDDIEKMADSFADAIEVKDVPTTESTKIKLKGGWKGPVVKKPKVEKDPEAKQAEKEEIELQRQTLIASISVMVETFEPLLKSITHGMKDAYIRGLSKKSLAELKATESVIKEQVKIGNVSNQLRHMYYMCASGLEVGGSIIGLKTEGYTRVLMSQDDEIRMILQEIALLHKDKFTMSTRPELRLGLLSFTALMATDSKNRSQLRDTPVRDTPVVAVIPENTEVKKEVPPNPDGKPQELWMKYDDL